MVPGGNTPIVSSGVVGRGSVSGIQMGFDSSTLSGSEAGSIKRKMSSTQQTGQQFTQFIPQDTNSSLGKPRKPSSGLALVPPTTSQPTTPLQSLTNQMSMTSLNNKSPTNELRESDESEHNMRNTDFGPFRNEQNQNSLKTFATRNGTPKNVPKAPESLPRKPSLNGSETQQQSSNNYKSSSRGDLTMLNSPSGPGSKPCNTGLQSFGGRQTPISFHSNSNIGNNSAFKHPETVSNNSHLDNGASKFI